MGKIIFFEDRNFQGRSYECASDCPELSAFLTRCQSCRVESGCFVLYDRPNFAGQQSFLRRGEYADYQRIGLSGSIQSCRLIPQYRGAFRMRMYERENFAGQMRELTEDCESIQERFHLSDLQSCQVEGHWLACEQPHFRGRVWYLRPGEYRSWRDMGVANMPRLCSVRRITDSC